MTDARAQTAASLLRWAARLTSVLSVGFLLLFLFGGGESLRPTAGEALMMLFFPFGVAAGLVLAWRREGLGAAVSAVSLAAFYLVQAAQSGGGLPRGPWFAVFASPAALFFASWLLRRDWRGGRRKAAAL